MGVSRDAEIYSVFPIISGMGKATSFKFGRYIHKVFANKSPLRIWEKRECWRRGVARGGDMGECPPPSRHRLKKILAPELQTDGCFATGVTRQTLLKPNENVQFQR